MILPASRALDKISKGAIGPGYLLLGREIYWRDRIWSALRRATGLAEGSTGIAEFDLRQHSLDTILAQAAERNLWAQRQMVLVRNAHSLSGAKPLESLAYYFGNPNPDSVLVFEMTDVDLDSDDWREREKTKTRQEHWEPICDVVLLAPPPMRESTEILRREAEARGCKITPPAAEALLALLDGDLGRAVPEIEKLCLYRGVAKEITDRDVDLLSGHRGSSHGLSLPQAIGTGEPAKILESFEEQVPKGAYLPLVVAEITRYLRQLLLLQQSRARHPQEASKILWGARLPAPQPLLPELMRQARAFPAPHLVQCFRQALRTEVALRSSPAADRLIVERFLLEIAVPLRPGAAV